MISPGSNFVSNAASLIARAAPLGPLHDLAVLPPSALSLMQLPEQVALVRAKGDRVFHLAEKAGLRGNTSLYPWLFECTRILLEAPSHYMQGNKVNHHRLLGPPASAHEAAPKVALLSVIVKFVPRSAPSGSGKPELWLATIELHGQDTAANYLAKAITVNGI